MKRIFPTILSGLSVIGLIAAVVVNPHFALAGTFYPVQANQFQLAGSGVSSSATSIQVVNFVSPSGNKLTNADFSGGNIYGVLDPNSPTRIENVICTGVTQGVTSATLTGCSRGVDFVYPFTASTTLAKSHAGGAYFILTNSAAFYWDEFVTVNGNNATTWPNASTSPATKGYVDFVAFNGAAVINANTTNRGVVQIGTRAQSAASTPDNGSGAYLALTTVNSTSTPYTTGSSLGQGVIPVTKSTGKIDDNFISTSTLLAATSTINIGSFPAWQIGKQYQVITSTGTSTFSVPSGITKIWVEVQGGGGGGGSKSGSGAGAGGGGGGYAASVVDVTGTSTIQVYVAPTTAGANASNNPQNASWSTFGTNGYYISCGGGAGGASATPGAGGTCTGTNATLAYTIPGQTGGGQGGNSGGGVGGHSNFGFGGPIGSGWCSTSGVAGVDGTGYGAAGSGACDSDSSPGAGGTGAQGIVIVRW